MRKLFFPVLGLLLGACATAAGPAWTVKGAGAFPESGSRVFYGVGLAPAAITDESLRRETADNRARADIQRIFSATIEGAMTSRTADDTERVERVLGTFQSGKISWVQIVDRYQAPDGAIYSLAKLDLDRL